MLATLARLTNGLFACAADMADSKIDKLTKDKTELQAQVKVLEQQVKSLKMENEVLKDKVKDVDAKIDIAVAAATGKVREAFEKEVQAAFERGQKFMLETIQTAKNTLFAN